MGNRIVLTLAAFLAYIQLVSAVDFSLAFTRVNSVRAKKGISEVKLVPSLGDKAFERLTRIRSPAREFFKNDVFKIFVQLTVSAGITDQDAMMAAFAEIKDIAFTANMPAPGFNAIGFGFLRKSPTVCYLLVLFDTEMELELYISETEALLEIEKGKCDNKLVAEAKTNLAAAKQQFLKLQAEDIIELRNVFQQKLQLKQSISERTNRANLGFHSKNAVSEDEREKLKNDYRKLMYMETKTAIEVAIANAHVKFVEAKLELVKLEMQMKESPDSKDLLLVNKARLNLQVAEDRVALGNWKLKMHESEYDFLGGRISTEKYKTVKAGLRLTEELKILAELKLRKCLGNNLGELHDFEKKVLALELEVDIAELQLVLAKLFGEIDSLSITGTPEAQTKIDNELVPVIKTIQGLIHEARQSTANTDE